MWVQIDDSVQIRCHEVLKDVVEVGKSSRFQRGQSGSFPKKKRSLGSPISRVGWFDLLGERGNVRDAQSAPVNIRSQILNE